MPPLTNATAARSLAIGVSLVMACPMVPTLAQSVTKDVVGSAGVISPIVSDYDKTVQFYKNFLGLDPGTTRLASAKENPPPPLLKVEGTPTASMRWSRINFPGTLWWAEPLEFTDIERKPVDPRLQDPGSATTILHVRHLDRVLARMKEAGVPIVTPGGSPVRVDFGLTKGRAVIVRDPDGHALQLTQPDTVPADAPSSEVIGGGVRVTVNDTDRTMDLYRDLGFEARSGRFAADRGFGALTGFEGAQYRVTTTTVPGEPRLTFEFIEFKGVDRRPLRTRIQDPGATRFQLMVRDLSAAVAKFRKAGGKVVSFDEQPVTYSPTAPPAIVVRDLNNFFIILQQQAANR